MRLKAWIKSPNSLSTVTGSGKGDASGDSGTGDGGVGTGDTEVRILNWQAYIDPTNFSLQLSITFVAMVVVSVPPVTRAPPLR